jgi:hypothetical protein
MSRLEKPIGLLRNLYLEALREIAENSFTLWDIMGCSMFKASRCFKCRPTGLISWGEIFKI